jgi:hypothetical protein
MPQTVIVDPSSSAKQRRGNTIAQTINLTIDGLAEQLRRAAENGAASARLELAAERQALATERAHSSGLMLKVLDLTDKIQKFTGQAVLLEIHQGRQKVELDRLEAEREDSRLLHSSVDRAMNHLLPAAGAADAGALAKCKETLGEVMGELMADGASAAAMRALLIEFLGHGRWARLCEAVEAIL